METVALIKLVHVMHYLFIYLKEKKRLTDALYKVRVN